MTHSVHPDPATMRLFILGRLDGRTMARVEAHLRGCAVCEQVAQRIPDDRLVTLLRIPANDPSSRASR